MRKAPNSSEDTLVGLAATDLARASGGQQRSTAGAEAFKRAEDCVYREKDCDVPPTPAQAAAIRRVFEDAGYIGFGYHVGTHDRLMRDKAGFGGFLPESQ